MGEIQDKEKIAELCGAIIGDGWIQSNESGFFIAGDPTEDKDYYDYYLAPLISKILISVKPKDFPYWGVYGISIYKKEYINQLLKFGLPKGKKVNSAEIPEWIKKANAGIKKAFIRGFFDADGCIFCQKDYTKYANVFNSKYHSKARLRVSSISPKLIEQLFGLLQELDFRCTKRVIKKKFSNNRNNSDVHILEINRLGNIKRFFEDIQPKNSKHITKYTIWKKWGFCPPNTTIIQRKDILKKNINPYDLYV